VIHIKGLDHVVIRARDLERMIRFYCDALGCSVDKRRDDLGLVHLRAGQSLIDLISVEGLLGQQGGAPPQNEGRNMDHLCLQIDPFNIEEIRAHFAAFGIEVGDAQNNYGAEGYGPSVYISDPEGNTVELKGPPNAQALCR
jgi:catechol 2,3-dioxygenase-like lactoylglutathione lyase family enzyme